MTIHGFPKLQEFISTTKTLRYVQLKFGSLHGHEYFLALQLVQAIERNPLKKIQLSICGYADEIRNWEYAIQLIGNMPTIKAVEIHGSWFVHRNDKVPLRKIRSLPNSQAFQMVPDSLCLDSFPDVLYHSLSYDHDIEIPSPLKELTLHNINLASSITLANFLVSSQAASLESLNIEFWESSHDCEMDILCRALSQQSSIKSLSLVDAMPRLPPTDELASRVVSAPVLAFLSNDSRIQKLFLKLPSIMQDPRLFDGLAAKSTLVDLTLCDVTGNGAPLNNLLLQNHSSRNLAVRKLVNPHGVPDLVEDGNPFLRSLVDGLCQNSTVESLYLGFRNTESGSIDLENSPPRCTVSRTAKPTKPQTICRRSTSLHVIVFVQHSSNTKLW